ncbi:hypothetical protein PTKIN_Ptkin16aG0478800 [Pterospermum kingtungense]
MAAAAAATTTNATRSVPARCISSFPVPQPETLVDWNGAFPCSECGFERIGGAEQAEFVVLKFGNLASSPGHGALIRESDCCFMVVFHYGSIVLFNAHEHEVDWYLKIVEKHATGFLPEMRRDGEFIYS